MLVPDNDNVPCGDDGNGKKQKNGVGHSQESASRVELPGAKGFAFDQRQNEVSEAVAILVTLFHNGFDLMLLRVIGNAASGVDHEFLGNALREKVDVVDQPGFELDRILNLSSIGKRS